MTSIATSHSNFLEEDDLRAGYKIDWCWKGLTLDHLGL